MLLFYFRLTFCACWALCLLRFSSVLYGGFICLGLGWLFACCLLLLVVVGCFCLLIVLLCFIVVIIGGGFFVLLFAIVYCFFVCFGV